MQEYITRFCWNSGTGQAVTTDAVSENTIAYAAVGPVIGMNPQPIIKILVKTAFAGMASGMNIDVRLDTAANLTTAPIVLARLPAKKIAELAAGTLIQIPWPIINPPATYDSIGLYFDLVNEAATAGNFIAWLGQGPEVQQTRWVYAAI